MMGEIADMILDGILSEDGEYIGGDLGFPRSALREQSRKPLTRFHCQHCARRFRSPAALADHVTAKHTQAAMIAAAAPDLLRELTEARTTLSNTRTHIMVEINRGVDRWEGVPEKLKERIDAIDAAVAKAGGEAA